jgi:hypothetical protein
MRGNGFLGLAGWPSISSLFPAMAVEPERTFSLAKLVITLQWHRMSDETLNEIQCLKSWARHRVIRLPAGIVEGQGLYLLDNEE